MNSFRKKRASFIKENVSFALLLRGLLSFFKIAFKPFKTKALRTHPSLTTLPHLIREGGQGWVFVVGVGGVWGSGFERGGQENRG